MEWKVNSETFVTVDDITFAAKTLESLVIVPMGNLGEHHLLLTLTSGASHIIYKGTKAGCEKNKKMILDKMSFKEENE